jgi:hypothetical protein
MILPQVCSLDGLGAPREGRAGVLRMLGDLLQQRAGPERDAPRLPEVLERRGPAPAGKGARGDGVAFRQRRAGQVQEHIDEVVRRQVGLGGGARAGDPQGRRRDPPGAGVAGAAVPFERDPGQRDERHVAECAGFARRPMRAGEQPGTQAVAHAPQQLRGREVGPLAAVAPVGAFGARRGDRAVVLEVFAALVAVEIDYGRSCHGFSFRRDALAGHSAGIVVARSPAVPVPPVSSEPSHGVGRLHRRATAGAVPGAVSARAGDSGGCDVGHAAPLNVFLALLNGPGARPERHAGDRPSPGAPS